MKNSLTCFGVADGLPSTDRNHAAFLYRFERTSILVDCGEPVDRSLKASGLSYDSIDAILLSHLHSDHVGGFFMLMQGFWLERRRRDLPVHLPGYAIKPLRQMLETVLLFEGLMKFRLKFAALQNGRRIKLPGVNITAYPTTHLDGLRSRFPKKSRATFSAHSFLFESGKKRIGHSADLGRPEDLAPLLKQPLDLLVCELAHFTPKEIFSYLRGSKVRRVAFVHLSERYYRGLPRIRRMAAKMLPDIPHVFPADGNVVRW